MSQSAELKQGAAPCNPSCAAAAAAAAACRHGAPTRQAFLAVSGAQAPPEPAAALLPAAPATALQARYFNVFSRVF